MKAKLSIGLLGLAMTALLGACQTIEGVGSDLADAGVRTREAVTGEPQARGTAQGGAESRNRD